MDIKQSTALCEGYLVGYVNAATSASEALTTAFVSIVDHVITFDECSLLVKLQDKVKAYGSSKDLRAFNMLARLTVPFDLKSGKKKQDNVAKCAELWASIKPELTGDDAISLSQWFDDHKDSDASKTADKAKAEKAAKKKAKAFEEGLAERKLSDPMFNKAMAIYDQLHKAYEVNPAEAEAMAAAFITKVTNAISARIQSVIEKDAA